MKKIIVAVTIFALSISTLFTLTTESPVFVKTVDILKVFSHQLGYRVLYLKSDLSAGVISIPHAWAHGDNSKAEYVLGSGPEYPSISFFWQEGELILVRLYLHENKDHISWELLITDEDVAAKFDNPTYTPDF